MGPASGYALRRNASNVAEICSPIFEISFSLTINDSVSSTEGTLLPSANDLRLLRLGVILGGSEVHRFSRRSAVCSILVAPVVDICPDFNHDLLTSPLVGLSSPSSVNHIEYSVANGLIKSNVVSPTARHRCDVSSWLCWPDAKPLKWTPLLVASLGVIPRV